MLSQTRSGQARQKTNLLYDLYITHSDSSHDQAVWPSRFVSAWPSSPRTAANPADQHLRDSLAQYELPRASLSSRQPSPPQPPPPPQQQQQHQQHHDHSGVPSFTSSFASYANPNDAGWQIPSARSFFKGLDTGPPTRRSSMASNVHSLLNPADTAEREGEDEGGPMESAKRKRLL